jgi:hypothetical protein
MNYLKIDERQIMDEKLELRGENTIKDNPLTDFFQSEGYEIMNYGCFDFNNAAVKGPPYITKEIRAYRIDNQTIVSRIMRDIWWNFSRRNWKSTQMRSSTVETKERSSHVNRNVYNYNAFVQELELESQTPKFVFAHLMLPHDPFYLDSNGHYLSDTALFSGKLDTRDLYLMQVKYANTLIRKIVGLANKKTKRPRIVLIQGDHGYRFYTKGKMDAAFVNLNAYYFSDHDYSLLYNGISPVNSFRVILNKYFNCSLPLLADSCVYIWHPRMEK